MEPDSGNPLPESLSLFLFASPPTEALLWLFAIFCLCFLSALLAAARVAFFSLTTVDLQKMLKEDSAHSRRVVSLLRAPDHLLITFHISSILLTLAVILFAHFFVFYLVQTWSVSTVPVAITVSQHSNVVWANAVSFSVTTTVVAFLMLLVNEAIPKAYSQQHRITLAKGISSIVMFLAKLFNPLTIMFLSANKRIERRFAKGSLFPKRADKTEIGESIDLAAGNNNKIPAESEVDMLKTIVNFNDVTVRQIMTSRMDVVAVDESITYADLLKVVQESGYSRIPVYEDDFDNIKGILNVKDLLKHLNVEEDFNWRILIRPTILYVPEAKKISDLLREFQRRRLHLAIVVDEYGGSAGIVTLEDVLEELIGDIKDEFDDEAEVQFRQLDEYTYIFEGKTLLPDVYRITDIEAGTFDEVRGEADSLAGLMLALHGQLPKKDSELSYKNFRFKIIAVTKRRIEQVQISFQPDSF